MLESIRSVLSIGGTEWGTVENLHLQEWPEIKRSKDSLRRKFSSLYRTKMPTGNPACPPLVRLAKQVQGEIKFRIMASGGENNGEESNDDDDEDNDSSSTDLQMGGVVVATEDAPPVVIINQLFVIIFFVMIIIIRYYYRYRYVIIIIIVMLSLR